MLTAVTELRERCGNLEANAIDARCRSMQYNLLFLGIDEAEKGCSEECEAVLKAFIGDKLKEAGEFPMKNVHRIGQMCGAVS